MFDDSTCLSGIRSCSSTYTAFSCRSLRHSDWHLKMMVCPIVFISTCSCPRAPATTRRRNTSWRRHVPFSTRRNYYEGVVGQDESVPLSFSTVIELTRQLDSFDAIHHGLTYLPARSPNPVRNVRAPLLIYTWYMSSILCPAERKLYQRDNKQLEGLSLSFTTADAFTRQVGSITASAVPDKNSPALLFVHTGKRVYPPIHLGTL